jgi:23S rRNA pseudouridine2604 synthase
MAWTRIYDGDEPVRINKWLAQAGVCSRREAEALIASGQIFIDGERVDDAGRKILPGQTLSLSSGGSAQLASRITVLINKPVGYVSAQPEGEQIPAARLLQASNLFGPSAPAPDAKTSLAPLGRLDLDSHGLLILSEDGSLAKAVIGPESPIDKEYLVRVEGKVDRARITLLRHGLELDGRTLKPAKVKQEDTQLLRFTLTEGRNRQIRRMCELVGLAVTDLLRIRIGPIELGDLPEGKWRPMTDAEREAVITAAKGKP